MRLRKQIPNQADTTVALNPTTKQDELECNGDFDIQRLKVYCEPCRIRNKPVQI